MNYIVDNNTYILSKDKNKNNVTNKQIQDIVFKIFLEIDRICRKYDIGYALSFGSALGLYNYGDFIPWDDDGDVAIDYFSYDKFVDALKSDLGDDFTFECYEVDDRCSVLIPPIKIRYKHSFIKEKNDFTLPNRTGRGNGIFVDVCPFMGVPQDIKEHKKIIFKSKWRMPFYVFLDAFLHINPKWMKKKLKKIERETAEKYKNSDYVSQSVIIPFQEYPKKIVEHLSFPKEVIYPFKEYNFRGHRLFSFNDIEAFSLLRYGSKSLKKKDGNKWIPSYTFNENKGGHLVQVDIFK